MPLVGCALAPHVDASGRSDFSGLTLTDLAELLADPTDECLAYLSEVAPPAEDQA